MHRFVADIQKERFVSITTLQPIERIFGQFIRDVAALWNAFSIDVETIVCGLWDFASRPVTIGPIRSLSTERDPVVKATLWVVDVATHVPFADERGLVTGVLQ